MFTEQERQVYSCPHTKRAYDPLAVRRVLLTQTKQRFGKLCAENTDDARGQLIAAARVAFSLPPIVADGSGVLEAVVWDTLCAFTGWLKGKEKRAQTTLAPVPSTACPERSITPPGSP